MNIKLSSFMKYALSSLFNLNLLTVAFIFTSTSVLAFHESRPLSIGHAAEINLNGYLSVYKDVSRQSTVRDVSDPAQDLMHPIDGPVSEGFTSGNVWVAFTLKYDGDEPLIRRWLELREPLLFNSSLYEVNTDGQISSSPSYLNRAKFGKNHQYIKSIFEIELMKNKPKTFYLKINSESSITSEIILWEPGRFVAATTIYRFLWGSVYGAYFIVILFYFAFWLWSREIIYFHYFNYLSLLSLTSFFSGAWPQQFFPDLNTGHFFKMLGIIVSLTPVAAMVFSHSFLRFIGNWRIFSNTLLVFITTMAFTSISLVLSDRFGTAMPVIQLSAFLVMILTLWAAFNNLSNGNKNIKLFILAFIIFYAGMVLRILKNFGILESNQLTSNIYQMGIFLHIMLMSANVFMVYNDMRTSKIKSEHQLNLERNIRKEQNEFISLLSHEFRTPLSIISASTENILRISLLNTEIGNRIKKISAAAQRMSDMMTSHFSNERFLNDLGGLELKAIELNEEVQLAMEDYLDHKHPPQFEPWTMPISIMADEAMIPMIVHNLVGNAMRYAPEADIHVSCRVAGQWAEIVVSDQGPDIPEKDLPHIFKKHFRGGNTAGTSGTGLGLYLIHSVVDKLHGQVMVKNRATGGCEFVVRLPTQDGRHAGLERLV